MFASIVIFNYWKLGLCFNDIPDKKHANSAPQKKTVCEKVFFICG